MMKEFSFLDGVGYLFPVFLSRFGAFLTSLNICTTVSSTSTTFSHLCTS